MPSGRTHTLINVTSIPLFAGGIYVAGGDIVGVGEMIAGMTLGIMLSPDLDVDGGNISSKYIRDNIGVIPAVMWFWFWYPYAKRMKHRSFYSHFPVISTIIRWIYIGIIPIGIAYYLGYEINLYNKTILAIFMWCSVSDALHYLADKWL